MGKWEDRLLFVFDGGGFAFELGEEFGEGEAAAGILGGIRFGEVGAAAVVAPEGLGYLVTHPIALARPEQRLGGEVVVGRFRHASLKDW